MQIRWNPNCKTLSATMHCLTLPSGFPVKHKCVWVGLFRCLSRGKWKHVFSVKFETNTLVRVYTTKVHAKP